MPGRILPFGRRPQTIRFWLGWLAFACVLPSALVATYLIYGTYVRGREDLQNANVVTARALMQVVDRELTGAVAALYGLASSPHLQTGEFEKFQSQAERALPNLPGSYVVLVAPDGRQHVNTFVPYGTPLVTTSLDLPINQVLRHGRPVITDVFVGAITKRPVVAVGVPVRVGDAIGYSLVFGILPQRFSWILGRQQLPAGGLAAILDSGGTIVARSEKEDEFVGKKGNPALLAAIRQHGEGTIETRTLDGAPVFVGYSRSPEVGWSVVIGTPATGLVADLRRSVTLYALTVLLVVVIGAVGANAISRRISGAIKAVVVPAFGVASDPTTRIPEGPILEVNDVGHALGVAARTIEQRVRERDEAARLEREADEANRAKSKFLTLMSHELRTPMNSILGFAQLLALPKFGTLNARQREYVGLILSSGNHLLRLISDILDLSKVDAEKLEVSCEPVDLLPLLSSVAATLQPAAETAGISLLPVEGGGTLPTVRADRLRLSQILINLGSNAIKYNRRGGTVVIGCECPAEGTVRIFVDDDGIGIAPDKQSELFVPFSRLGAERSGIEGTGVGLALSRQLAELMGGAIGMTSAPGRGSRFWLDLPEHRPAAA
ncbi:MAG: hypothetical protein HY059_03230 [Proteobacteria bacterium]|nr:hypothetical protein [Pseudomonadota bacterium]